MSEKPDDPTLEERDSDLIVRNAQIGTFIWVGLIFVLLLARLKEASELSLPNWGDFFAGFAAPLAFLWLVVATFIQRNELRAQIKELSASRKALEAQIDEQKISAVSLKIQSEILQNEWDEKKKSIESDDIFDILSNEIKTLHLNSPRASILYSLNETNKASYTGSFSYLEKFGQIADVKNRNDIVVYLNGIIEIFNSNNKLFLKLNKNNKIKKLSKTDNMLKIMRDLEDIISFVAKKSSESTSPWVIFVGKRCSTLSAAISETIHEISSAVEILEPKLEED